MRAASVCTVAMLGSATAFVTPFVGKAVSAVKSTSTMKMASSMDGLAGVSLEAGNKVFDPLSLAELSKTNNDLFPHAKWLLEAEAKHGRMCMLAFVGIIACNAGIVFPGMGYSGDTDWTHAFSEFATKNPFGFAQLALSMGLIEGQSDPSELWYGRGRQPANLGFDPLGLNKKGDDAQKMKMQLAELKNGRAAMIGIAALCAEKYIPGSVPIEKYLVFYH